MPEMSQRPGAGMFRLAWRRIKTALRPNVIVSQPSTLILAEWDVPVAMRDGVILRVNVFRPRNAGPVPVIMSAHPYGKDKIPARSRSGQSPSFQYHLFPQPDPVKHSTLTSWEAPDPDFWVPNGYAVVNCDLRGSGTSEGIGELFSDLEAQDYFDLIEWAAAQPWSSGKIGLDGVSYLAISQYKVAALHPPHLAAICPWEGLSDLYRDFARPGGIREDGFSKIWSHETAKTRVHTQIRPGIVAHEDFDDWWRERTPKIEDINVPMLVCTSFSDQSLHTRGSFEVFRRSRSSQKWAYTHRSGKWSTYYGAEASQTRKRFFDYTLKDIENGWAQVPSIRLAIHEQGPDPVAIVGEGSWPPSDLSWQHLYLDAKTNQLGFQQPGRSKRSSFSLRGSGLSFNWVVPEDIDIIGPMALQLPIEIKGGVDANLFVGIRKFSRGREIKFEGTFGFAGDMVTKGWQRVSYRDLDTALSTPEQPFHTHAWREAFRSGEIFTASISLRPQATRFRKGDRLQLVIQGKWFYARNPLWGQFPAGYLKSPDARCIVHTGDMHEAHLLIGYRPIAKTAMKAPWPA